MTETLKIKQKKVKPADFKLRKLLSVKTCTVETNSSENYFFQLSKKIK